MKIEEEEGKVASDRGNVKWPETANISLFNFLPWWKCQSRNKCTLNHIKHKRYIVFAWFAESKTNWPNQVLILIK